MPGYYFVHAPEFLFRLLPQLWRPVTCFLITSPKLGILFDTYFMYQYMSQLEQGNSRFPRKEDFLWYLIFVGSTILVGPSLSYLPALAPVTRTTNKAPHHICPNSVMPLQLLRFLEMRKITPALPLAPSFANPGLVGGVGMVGCLMDGSCDSLFA